MIVVSLAEVISIGALIPFLGVLTSPEFIFNEPQLKPILDYLGILQMDQIVLPVTVGFVIAIVIAGSLRLVFLWASTRLSFSTGAELGNGIYRKTLFQPYQVHISRNSSEVISGIITKSTMVIVNILLPVLSLIGSVVMIVAIMSMLILISPFISIIAFACFLAIYAGIYFLTRNRLSTNSQIISKETGEVTKSLIEGLGAIREILLDGSQEIYCQVYKKSDRALRRAQGTNIFIAQSPRFIVEALAVTVIALLAYRLNQDSDSDMANIVPILGAFALGAQRLLPVVQLAYSAFTQIQSGKSSLVDTLELLDQHVITPSKDSGVSFNDDIQFRKVSFRYENSAEWILKDVDISIKKGCKLGIIGATGSGKSTLVDILMGLLTPSEGVVEIDGTRIDGDNLRSWQRLIAHVPQNIYLSDSSIMENIAFGVPKLEIDIELVEKAASQAHISSLIETWPDKYDTIVGERGVRISGGQRQRIAIARALYKKAEVIIFDEATSALDADTEEAVIRSLELLDPNLTIIAIAHRHSTLRMCSKILEVTKSRITILDNNLTVDSD